METIKATLSPKHFYIYFFCLLAVVLNFGSILVFTGF